MSYSNEAWGDPTQTYKYLSDSNTDWAQQLIGTADYLRQHHITDCYIAYFAATAILPSDYSIPCKLLPTPDATYYGDFIDAPPVIHGTVLISAGTVNGFETGSRVLNPYESFRSVQPVDFIQNGIFVFDGTFSIPLAEASAHVSRSGQFLGKNDIENAIRKAQTTVQLATQSLQAQFALGDALAANHHPEEARQAYQSAAAIIDTMEPDARTEWADKLKQKSTRSNKGRRPVAYQPSPTGWVNLRPSHLTPLPHYPTRFLLPIPYRLLPRPCYPCIRMKRSLQVSAPLLAAVALSVSTGCRKPEMQRCVDEQNRVVADNLCQNTGSQQPIRNSTGGFYYPYRFYYGGMGGYGLGSPVTGGNYAPLAGHSYSSSTTRGGFGTTHSGGGESGHGSSGGE